MLPNHKSGIPKILPTNRLLDECVTKALGLCFRLASLHRRITSYNVCYTKLLRKISIIPKYGGEETTNGFVDQLKVPPALKSVLEETFGFQATARTLTYIMKRLNKLGFSQRSKSFFQKIFVITSYSIHYTKLYDGPLHGWVNGS